MAKKTTKFHCGACTSGVIKMIENWKGDKGTVEVKPCDSCGHQTGIFGTKRLKQINS